MHINHNISAQVANVSLKKTNTRLSASLERLSTGYRINKAADDSAGMAISNKMRTQIRALNQAGRNTSDGDSVIQTAEGALNEIQSVLQRIRELGVEAANDTMALEDRIAIQDEIDQMLDEVDRISSTTEYNGRSLLDGSASRTAISNSLSVRPLAVSMSAPAGDYEITVDSVAESAKMSLNCAIPATGSYTIKLNGADLKINSSDSESEVQAKVMEMCDAMNIKCQAFGTAFDLETKTMGKNQNISLQYPGDPEPTITHGKDATISMGAGFDDPTGYTYRVTGSNITIEGNNDFQLQFDCSKAAAGDSATVRVENAGYMIMQIGANEHQTLNADFGQITCEALCLRDSSNTDLINACTQAGASNLLDVLDSALSKVSAARALLGSYQNRLDATKNSLDVSEENLTDAMSRIMDTDMAAEMTQYTQLDVLTQAATSMLSQANNRPQTIMNLLQS